MIGKNNTIKIKPLGNVVPDIKWFKFKNQTFQEILKFYESSEERVVEAKG